MSRLARRSGQPTRRRALLAGVAALTLLSACGGGGGNSSSTQSESGSGSGAPANQPPEPGVCKGCQPPLAYKGGPVMATDGLTITPVYWAPSGYTIDPAYVSGVNQYLTDIAAASGAASNTYAVTPEYSQQNNGSTQNIEYKIAMGSPIMDTTAFPATDATSCTVTDPNTACVTKNQMITELQSQLQGANLPADLSHLYALLLPPKVASSDGQTTAGFCGYHDAARMDNGSYLIWADEPYPTAGCDTGEYPNNNPYADAEVSVLSHEIIEAETDPIVGSAPGWVDGAFNEIGDECNFQFGPPLGTADPTQPRSAYNQVINGHDYYTQQIFSNAAFAAQGQGQGCITAQYGSASPAVATRLVAAQPPDQALVNLSEVKLAADGTSTSNVTDEIVDGSGEPVANSPVHFDVEPVDETAGPCGTVNPADATTNTDGDATTTYTASKSNAACIVVAIDNKDGASDWATLYQGSSADNMPAITDGSVPSSIAPGSGAQTFTITVKNPAHDAISDARYDVFLSGDDGNGKGLSASQVHISYTTGNGSSPTALSLNGETTGNGDIEGDAVPDSAHQILAGATETVTFTITIDGGAPTSSATGNPLTLEVDLDQYNPADDSTDNLDYASADITIG